MEYMPLLIKMGLNIGKIKERGVSSMSNTIHGIELRDPINYNIRYLFGNSLESKNFNHPHRKSYFLKKRRGVSI